MGYSVSAALLQSSLMNILGARHFNGAIIYVDDILVHSKGSKEEHIRLMEEVLDKLAEADARMKLSKIKLAQQRLTFLGMTITKEGWQIDEKFLQTIQDAKKPNTLKSLRSLLGLANWQRGFIPHHAELVEPMARLVKKGADIS